VKYGIITDIAYSDPNTTVTVFLGEDYDMDNETINSVYYSTLKAPQGFPTNPNKWTVYTLDNSSRTQSSPTSGTWYNINSEQIDIPMGSWKLGYWCSSQINKAAAGSITLLSSLSTSTSSEISGSIWTNYMLGSSLATLISPSHRKNTVTFSTGAGGDIYYLIHKTLSAGMASIQVRGDVSGTLIKAECAYL
jgi:hypothetical protein